MIPFILAAVGGYLIGDSMKDSQKFAEGGVMADGGFVDYVIFDQLKKGDRINITFGSSISKNSNAELLVKSKNLVGKGKSYESEKITFVNTKNPNGVRFFAYKRKGGDVGFAVGDLAIWDVKIVGDIFAEGGTLDENYENYEIVVVGKDAEKDGGGFHHMRYLVSAKNMYEAKVIASDMFEEEWGDADFYLFEVLSDSEHRLKYMAEGGTLDEIVEVETEVKQMNGSTILFEVEIEYYNDKEEKYYFEYEWDNESHSLQAIYDSKMMELDKQSSNRLEKELEEKMTYAVRDAISDYYDAKAEPDEFYEED